MWLIKINGELYTTADSLESLQTTAVRYNNKLQELKDLVLNKIVFDDGERVQYIRGNLWVAFDRKDKQVCVGTRDECEMTIGGPQCKRLYEGGAIIAEWEDVK